ncbi:MAG: hypothetical protein FWG98_00795 [Candidatus Cloacimonetes bacterium]|nr:hypothetical protein [Candidatus Cloacimonadota bacterium]
MDVNRIIVFMVFLIGFIIFSGFLYVWVTMGRGTFWRGLSKKSIFDVLHLLFEAKQNQSTEYPEILKRTIIYFGVLIAFCILGFLIALGKTC